jgi:hypothetical protein
MPRHPTPTPPATEVFAALDRPPWHSWSSQELAQVLSVPLNWVWNHTMRQTGPEPDPAGLQIRCSTRRFFNCSVVLSWLSQREGEPIEPWIWCRDWLASRYLLRPDATASEVLSAVSSVERVGLYKRK